MKMFDDKNFDFLSEELFEPAYTLVPDNSGINCPCNGKHTDKNGVLIECRCDECDFMMDCIDENFYEYDYNEKD